MTNNTTPTEPHLGLKFAIAMVVMTAALTGLFALIFSTMGRTNTAPPSIAPDPTTPTTMPIRDGESAIYPGDALDYRDGAWWVDGVKVTGVDCPTEDSCYPMEHDGGWMIHETTP